jgi:hypothetical protein
MKTFKTIIAALTLSTLVARAQVPPEPGTFVFQGHLEFQGQPMTNQIDLRFDLYSQETGGNVLESVTKTVTLEKGHFAVPLTFNNLGDGDARWLELYPRFPGGAPTRIEPRQALHFAPLARWAANAGNAGSADTLKPGAVVNGGVSFTGNISAAQISGNGSQITNLPLSSTTGVLPTSKLSGTYGAVVNLTNRANTIAGTFSGNGSGLTNVSVDPSTVRISKLYWPADLDLAVVEVLANGRTSVKWALDVNEEITARNRSYFRGGIDTSELKLTGGADIAEPFDIAPAADIAPDPGMVVAIDPATPGALVVCSRAYDRTVAGIISGAGGVNPGMTLAQKGSIADGEHPVALTGRVYCHVDAEAGGAVVPGDLLTTSNTPGHAMKVTDHTQASGAIIGKAMTSLKQGRGLVLVLVSLQ